ncbi:MAG TPA: MBL fold metallo-hydrolase [Bryobacteraceae bacterium]
MQLSRRRFLMAAAGAVAARAQDASPALVMDRGFGRVSRIADRVYATIADASKGMQCASNGGILAGRDRTLLIEGFMQAAGAELQVAAAREVAKAPVRAVVDTHFHLDHSLGNSYYAEQRIPIMAHEQTGPMMKKAYEPMKAAERSRYLAPIQEKLAHAGSEQEKKRRQNDVTAAGILFDALQAGTLAYPTEALATRSLPMRMNLGGLTAVIEFHLGHTPTDLLIIVPERDIVFAGDLLFHRGFPVSIDADMVAWRRALDRLARFDRKTQIVPGHGPVCGQEIVEEQMALFDDMQAHADKMKAAGANAEEAAQRYQPPARFSNFRMLSWDFTIGAAMRSYYGIRAA